MHAIANILDSIPCAHACAIFVDAVLYKVHVHIIWLFQLMGVHPAEEENLNIFALIRNQSAVRGLDLIIFCVWKMHRPEMMCDKLITEVSCPSLLCLVSTNVF